MAVISKSTFNPLKRYIAVRLQQGVPIVDADVNELDDIRSFELRAFIKWFVGDGVPEGSDGFRIAANGLEHDVAIKRGGDAPPAGTDSITTGLNHVGRLFVDGRDALLERDMGLAEQDLHESQPDAAALASKWHVPVVEKLPPITGKVLVYLDVWDRLVTPDEEPELILPGLGTESAARERREWVVRWTEGAAVPPAGEAIRGHSYYALASIARRKSAEVVTDADITDLRERRLLVPPATLVDDVLGVTPNEYRRGRDRPVISLREAANALLRGELPATPAAPIAPDTAADEMSFAFHLDGPDVIGFWHSKRGGGREQIVAARWQRSDAGAAATAPAVPITAGTVSHTVPDALTLPGPERSLLVVYETAGNQVHFRRGADAAALAASPETAVSEGGARHRHPCVLRVGDQIVFVWQQQDVSLMQRRRKYPGTWKEDGATWAAPEKIAHTAAPAAPLLTPGGVHAVVAMDQVYIAFRAEPRGIGVARLDPGPATAVVENWGNHTLKSDAPDADGVEPDAEPYLIADVPAAGDERKPSVWAFWRGGNAGIFYQRLDIAASKWDPAGAAKIPGTEQGGGGGRPAGVCDASGAIWLFWVSDRAESPDIWLTRSVPGRARWREPMPIVTGVDRDELPFARLAEDGTIWLFWRRTVAGQPDLYYKRLVSRL